tara:strand:+ start:1438 stop:1950 length:513 start_codon:yes stop_codon:yes gene_type:complete
MPNWCSNRVTFSCQDSEEALEQLKEIKELFLSDNIFQKILPPPDWKNLPLSEEDLEYLGRKRGEVGELPVEKQYFHPNGNPIENKTLVFESTGVHDDRWYNWQVENWGTKWDVHRDHIEWGDDDEDYCVIHFDTAWSPPEEIAAELKEKYDRVSIQWFYDEPGMEFAGYL